MLIAPALHHPPRLVFGSGPARSQPSPIYGAGGCLALQDSSLALRRLLLPPEFCRQVRSLFNHPRSLQAGLLSSFWLIPRLESPCHSLHRVPEADHTFFPSRSLPALSSFSLLESGELSLCPLGGAGKRRSEDGYSRLSLLPPANCGRPQCPRLRECSNAPTDLHYMNILADDLQYL